MSPPPTVESEGMQLSRYAPQFATPDELQHVLKTVAELQRSGRDIISFAGGLPVGERLADPVALDLLDISTRILTDHKNARDALQYSETTGYPPLRQLIAESIGGKPENIMITDGLQEGIRKAIYVICDPGDVILAENFTYAGFLSAVKAEKGVEVWGIPSDADGIIPEAVDEAVTIAKQEGRNVKLLYLQNVGNPVTRMITTKERGLALLDRAQSHNFGVLQDDAYLELIYDGTEPCPPLTHFDPGRVIYGKTFSKTVAPGLRIGWIEAPEHAVPALQGVKMGDNIATSNLLQMLVYGYMNSGKLTENLPGTQAAYLARKLAMEEALQTYAEGIIDFTTAKGGMFVFGKNTLGVSTSDAAKHIATAYNVVYLSGNACRPKRIIGEDTNSMMENDLFMRLNFTNTHPSLMPEGVQRLVAGLREAAKNGQDV